MNDLLNFIVTDLSKLEQSRIVQGMAAISALTGLLDIAFNRSKYIFMALSKIKHTISTYNKQIAFILLLALAIKTGIAINVIADNNTGLSKCTNDITELQRSCTIIAAEKNKSDTLITDLNKNIEDLKNNNKILNEQLNAANSNKDYLVEWEVGTRKAISDCGICATDKIPACDCQRSAITKSINSMPYPDGEDNFNLDHRLNRMGHLLLSVASDVLNMDLGIKKKTFTGSGISSPYSPDKSKIEGIREYWAPNFREENSTVWTWEFESPLLASGKTVHDILKETPPRENSDKTHPTFSECQNDNTLCQFDIGTEKNSPRPLLFRCAMLPHDSYKNTVGRPEAKRVFFSRYRDVIDLTVSNACALTGREIKPNDGQSLFIWIFMPEDPQEAVPATWESLKSNFENWEFNH